MLAGAVVDAAALVSAAFAATVLDATLADASVTLGFVVASVGVTPGCTVVFASSPDRFGISPSKVKPAFIKAPTISIMDTPFILAPFGIVMILPTEFNITLFVISLNPNSFIISVTSGYSFTKSYTDLDKSNFFSILFPSCQNLYNILTDINEPLYVKISYTRLSIYCERSICNDLWFYDKRYRLENLYPWLYF